MVRSAIRVVTITPYKVFVAIVNLTRKPTPKNVNGGWNYAYSQLTPDRTVQLVARRLEGLVEARQNGFAKTTEGRNRAGWRPEQIKPFRSTAGCQRAGGPT